MATEKISNKKILEKLDALLGKNDYKSAEERLLYYKAQAESQNDRPTLILILNELAGLYRKLAREEDALNIVKTALDLISNMGIENNIGAATTYLNCATVYKAFGKADKSLPLFEKAKEIYETKLDRGDKRLGGLYNNMALTLVDLKDFGAAYALYEKAILVMKNAPDRLLEVAITYLNIASAKEEELGALDSEKIIEDYLKRAADILDTHTKRDGYYAFVCEKCASVYGYYGHFFYEKELLERARGIYEGS